MITELRDTIQNAIREKSYERAAIRLGQLMRQEPTASNASYVIARFAEINSYLHLTPCRLAVLRSFTIEPLISFLKASCFTKGIEAVVHVGGFNTYVQELLDPNSSLYRFEPDIVILAVRTPDITPELWYQFTELAETDVNRIVELTLANFELWIKTFQDHSSAHLILHNLEFPAYPLSGILDVQQMFGQKEAIQCLNQGLQQIAQKRHGVYLFDYDGLVARHGRLRWHDEHKWLTMRMPIAANFLALLVDEYMKFVLPLIGKTCKVLVVDLDNTLWGGVVGEDGLQGIQLGLEYPGAAYLALQRAIIDLYRRGVILAICSKNNSADALRVLEEHPDMLLHLQHFAAVRINWDDKAQNLCQIATELNVGIDALAFLDDSPVERDWIRNRLPAVHVIDLPDHPMLYEQTLRECPVFERVALSIEDKERGRYYTEQRQRVELQKTYGSLEDFYYSLQMKMEIAEANPLTIPRIAQLTQKTNQFNLTNRRYTGQEITSMTEDPQACVLSASVTDRFGNSGIIGVMISRREEDRCEIDTFLLSCRVIGRTIETAMLTCLAERALRGGAERIIGWYLPTPKNAPAKDFYAKHSFALARKGEEDSMWEFDLLNRQIHAPPWIEYTCVYKEMEGVDEKFYTERSTTDCR